ncbi:hypothetical protein A2U01_0048173 [Trifolium medium]|uniref:Uncharacterized protein n=1 Tax=Trifolium medium TaxID=97028 RepID=A0A392QUQ2_9FABA|nr:hypothetical protein [Trifolium medium]
MKASKQQRGCKALCCSSNRFSVSSSSEEAESSSSASNRFPSVSTLAHAMVQERLDQMIREKLEATRYGVDDGNDNCESPSRRKRSS